MMIEPVVIFLLLCPRPRREGAISVAFVRPPSSVCSSVRPSVTYIANNSTNQRLSVPEFGSKVSHLRCDSQTSFKIKRSKVRVTRPINADTHRMPYLPNGKTYKLQTWYIDGGRRSASATGAITSKEYILVDLAVNLSLGHFKNS